MSDFIYLDTETTGFSRRDKLVEAALIDNNGAVAFQSLINPGMNIPAVARKVHGITDDMVRTAPTWSDVEEEFLSHIRGRVLVGHNISFDLRFTGRRTKQAARTVVCTLKMAKETLKRPVKLDELARLANHQPDSAFHRATADAIATRAGHLWLLEQAMPARRTTSADPRCRPIDPSLCPKPSLSGAPWDKEADARLSALWKQGHDIPAILQEMPRTPRAIFARLERLGHVAGENNPYPLGR